MGTNELRWTAGIEDENENENEDDSTKVPGGGSNRGVNGFIYLRDGFERRGKREDYECGPLRGAAVAIVGPTVDGWAVEVGAGP